MLPPVNPALLIVGVPHVLMLIAGESEVLADIARLGLDDRVSVEVERS